MSKNELFTATIFNDTEMFFLTIEDKKVALELSSSEKYSVTYKSNSTAALVFENNLKSFEQKGYQIEGSCEDTLPGIFTIFEEDDRSWISFKDNQLNKVCIYDADTVGIWDGLYPDLQEAKQLGDFNPKNADPELFGTHCIRRFIAHPASAQCQEFALQLSINLEKNLNLIASSKRADRLTHLEIYDFWNSKSPHAQPRKLGSEFPQLKRLTIPSGAIDTFMSGVFPNLERLTIKNSQPEKEKAPPLLEPHEIEEMFNKIIKSAPALKHFTLQSYDFPKATLEKIAHHPLLQQLQTLDLTGTYNQFDYYALLELEPYFKHLQNIIVTTPLTDKKIIPAFTHWPEVLFASYDRREPAIKKIDEQWIF